MARACGRPLSHLTSRVATLGVVSTKGNCYIPPLPLGGVALDLKEITNSPIFILFFMLTGPLGGMALFSLQNRLRGSTPDTARVRQAGGSIFLNHWIKEYGYWWLRPQVRLLVAIGATPTAVTLGGLAIVLVGCAMVGCGYFGLGGLTILLGSLSDMLDGLVARARNMGSRAGEFVDSLVDRYSDVALIGGLVLYWRHELVFCFIALLGIMGTVVVSYARAKAESLGINDVPKGPMQRAERAVYLGFGIYLSPVVAYFTEMPSKQPTYWLALFVLSVVAVMTNYSAVTMTRYITSRLRDSVHEETKHAVLRSV